MVGSQDNLLIISDYLKYLNPMDLDTGVVPVVLDPVLASSSGRSLLNAEALRGLKAKLLRVVDWVTPNVDELALLTGMQVRTPDELAAGARGLQNLVGVRVNGAGVESRIGVFAKGGHLERPDDLLVTPEGEEHWLAGERIETNATHGTGCALSSAFLSRLVLGDDAVSAARKAKKYVAEAMGQAPGIGHGRGPMGLLWPLGLVPGR